MHNDGIKILCGVTTILNLIVFSINFGPFIHQINTKNPNETTILSLMKNHYLT